VKLSTQTVLITGGSRGIGWALAERFLKGGAKTLLVARSFPEDEAPAKAAKDNPDLVLLPCDLSKPVERKALCAKLLNDFDVDILVNNAGVLSGGLLQTLDPDGIETCIQVNLLASIQLSRALLPKMLEKKSGVIINNASVSAEFYFPGAQVYAASKAGLSLFTKSLAMELEGTGVRTLLLLTPGVKTKMYDDIQNRYGSFMKLDFLAAVTPEAWADRVFDSLEKEEKICYPSGKDRMGLFINRHFPSLYEKGMRSYFKGEEV